MAGQTPTKIQTKGGGSKGNPRGNLPQGNRDGGNVLRPNAPQFRFEEEEGRGHGKGRGHSKGTYKVNPVVPNNQPNRR